MAAFMYNVNKIHAIQDGFFSPGILWKEMVLYPLDNINTTRIANECLDWFERRIGPHMATIVPAYEGIPLYTGRLAQQFPGAGKRRIFVIT